MKKESRTLLYGAFALGASLVATPLMAGSAEFAGPYIAIQGAVTGVELDGSTTDSNSQVSNGTGGMFAFIGGFEAGYSIPLGDTIIVSIGASISPGEAQIDVDSGGSASTSNTDVTLEISDIVTYYIAPSFSVSEAAAVYLKFGRTDADLKVTGDVTKVTSVSGNTIAIGTRTLLNEHAFIATEAGYISYDNIKLTGLGTYIATTNSAQADPTAAYGQVTIGIKF